MTEPWTGARRNKAYKEAARKQEVARREWEEYLRDDSYRTAADIVRHMFPERPELKDLLEVIARDLEGREQ